MGLLCVSCGSCVPSVGLLRALWPFCGSLVGPVPLVPMGALLGVSSLVYHMSLLRRCVSQCLGVEYRVGLSVSRDDILISQ